MLLFEFFLNIAHQILKGGEKTLLALYPDSQEFYNNANREEWNTMFKDYSLLKGVPKQISAHYWNPTDFESA
jgi:hypothetical protein